MKYSKKIMIKKHQKCYTYVTYHRTFLKQLVMETFQPTKENSNIEENLCLYDKIINIVELLVQSDGETYCCCYNLLAHMTQISGINDGNVFLVYLIRKERFPAKKIKLMWEASRRSHTFC